MCGGVSRWTGCHIDVRAMTGRTQGMVAISMGWALWDKDSGTRTFPGSMRRTGTEVWDCRPFGTSGLETGAGSGTRSRPERDIK